MNHVTDLTAYEVRTRPTPGTPDHLTRATLATARRQHRQHRRHRLASQLRSVADRLES